MGWIPAYNHSPHPHRIWIARCAWTRRFTFGLELDLALQAHFPDHVIERGDTIDHPLRHRRLGAKPPPPGSSPSHLRDRHAVPKRHRLRETSVVWR